MENIKRVNTPKRDFSRRFQLTFANTELKEALEEIAEEENRSLSNLINSILIKYVKEHKG